MMTSLPRIFITVVLDSAALLTLPLTMVGMVAAAEHTATHTAEDLLRLASRYETEAQHHVAQAFQYQERAIDIDPITDTKGYRHQGLITAAESHNSKAKELLFRAKVRRAEAELLMERQPRNP